MLNIYRASAGSGKTYRLTKDYIHLLFNPKKEHTHRHILAVTFTNKATDEMKSRILKELYLLARNEPSNYRNDLMDKYTLNEKEVNEKAEKILIDILHDYSSFSISTIDRFFQQVIRAFARDIGVNGGYSLELDSNQTLEQAVDNLFSDLSKKENKQLLQWLTELAEERIENSESWNMRRNIVDLGVEIFKEDFQYKAEDISQKLHDRDYLNTFRNELRKIKHNFEEKVVRKAEDTLNLIVFYGLTPESFKGGSRSPMKGLEKLRKKDFKVSDSFFGLHEDINTCYTKTTPAHIIDNIEQAYINGLQNNLRELTEYLTKDFILYNSAIIIFKHISTLGVLSDLDAQIKSLTNEQNIMLISNTNMLLNRIIDNSDTPFIYEKTGIYLDNYMIDEFQDTSLLQWNNFKPLLNNSLSKGKDNLVVGDVKQSIYRWRNSDWKLLDEQILKDFRSEQIHEENLDTNWRSDKNIVEFNNSFFEHAANLLQSKLNYNIELALPVYKSLKSLQNRISHAYSNLHQKISPKAEKGYVKVTFIPTDEIEDNWKSESLRRLPSLLEELQDRGYLPSDIGILVRKNGEEQKVIQYLLNYKTTPSAKQGYQYDVMGNEGLSVNSAPSVRFILGLLYLFINSDNTIQRTIVNYEYLRGTKNKNSETALNELFTKGEESNEKISFLFTEEENEQLLKIRHSSLYEMVEQIIALFNIGSWHNETVFLQTFQDLVFRFSINRTADLNSFLQWWEKNGEKQYVPSPENSKAFRIMTIHKSKGLDFKVVIIPFCDWDLDSKMRNIIWCKTKESPFNKLPLIPVEYTSKLRQSIFAQEYFDEQMHQYIDNLNIGYVAFTRARNEIHCFSPKSPKETTDIDKVNSFSAVLYAHLQRNENFKDNIFTIGTPTKQEYKQETELFTERENLITYPAVQAQGRIQLRTQGFDLWREEQDITDNPLNFGSIMHNILQNIKTKSDEESVINSFIHSGMITEEESILVKNEMKQFWNNPQTEKWFSNDVKVLNETTIITPEENLYRPDRVVIQNNEATVVDYKFGEKESNYHITQVRQYMNMISQMGYGVKGAVYYVRLGKIIEI